jgi:arylsulfatase A-like enzyme
MSLYDFVETSRDWIREEGIQGVRYSLNQAWMGVLRRLPPLFESGTNVYEREWDLLIILDGCRVDALDAVADEFSFLDEPGTHRSTASTSGEWMRTTFVDEYTNDIEETIYVTANHHSDAVADLPFLAFENVYDYGWDDDVGTVRAETITDVAIDVGREYAASRDRLIVHYMQPHFPSVPRPIGHGSKFDNVWKGLMIGKHDSDEIWESYMANLRYVLEHVDTLLKNVDDEDVVITADHGNAKGEWGVYAHPLGVPIDCVKTVPWYTTTASDERTREPSVDRTTEADQDITERLAALGYR